MSGAVQVTQGGPKTFTPADNATVRGGRVVEAVAGGRIQEAGAASLVALGVALTDAIAPEDVSTSTANDALGRPVLTAVAIPTKVAVAYAGTEVKVTYAANASFGQKLICAANGTVTPAGATPDARTLIGVCTEPGGVVIATNAVGLMRIA